MRLIPITIIAMSLTLVLRVENVVERSDMLWADKLPSVHVQTAVAEDAPAEKEATKSSDKKKGKSEEDTEPANNCEFSQIEIDLLQSLSKRREEIEKKSEELKLKETMLKAGEMKIDDKIAEMRELKSTLEDLLSKYDSHEQQKIHSLVKIYENMKPKEAARIFEQMDMEVLLQVIDKMGERKVAPILANLTPTRAQEVTLELANRQKLPPLPEEPAIP